MLHGNDCALGELGKPSAASTDSTLPLLRLRGADRDSELIVLAERGGLGELASCLLMIGSRSSHTVKASKDVLLPSLTIEDSVNGNLGWVDICPLGFPWQIIGGSDSVRAGREQEKKPEPSQTGILAKIFVPSQQRY